MQPACNTQRIDKIYFDNNLACHFYKDVRRTKIDAV